MSSKPSDIQLECRIKELEAEVFSQRQHIESIERDRETLSRGYEKLPLPYPARDIWARTFDAINDIVTIQDRSLHIIKANMAAHQFFQLKEGELIGRHCYEVFTGTTEPCGNCPLLTTLKIGGRHSAVIVHENLGKMFQVSSSLIPATSDGEEYLVHVARDITAEIRQEKNLQESNERFAKAFESSPAPMIISEIDSGLFIDVNQQLLKMFGYAREEVIGRTSKEIGIWQEPEERGRVVALFSKGAAISNYPVMFLTKSGEPRSVLWTVERITIHGQELMLSLINDITEQKKAEEKLKESEEKFVLAFNSSPDAVNINRLEDGLYMDANAGFTELTGFTKDDILGKTSSELNIWCNPADRQRLIQCLKKKGYCENLEANFRRKDGSVTTALMSARIISLGDVPHIISITRDISRLRKIEREVLEQKLLFETMFNAIDDGVVITDTNRKILFANRGMKKTFGYKPEELKGKTTEILYARSEFYQTAGKNVYHKNALSQDRIYITAYKDKSGKNFPAETYGVKLYDQDNVWIGNLGIMRDISKRQKAEAERDRLIAAIEQTREAIVITDRDANIQYVNPAFELLTGYTSAEVLGQNPRILKSGEQEQDFYQDMWQTLTSGQTFSCRMVNRRKDGSHFTEEVNISPVVDRDGMVVNYVAVKRDITEQILLESQLHQAQKMEAVGRLTGGVAHDFNNILGVIIGYAEMALEDAPPGEKIHGDLSKILDAAERSADIVRQLLAFSRKQTISPKVLDLNRAVTGTLKLLKRLIGEDIDLAWLPAPGDLLIKMDPVQIDQILANLCVNAKDALASVGKITIETARVRFDNVYCASHVGFQPGEFVQLSISDNGCGIDKKALSHIFEPFFSTKELGRGTGLGLSTVYGIVKQNNGFINVYSEPGRGTIIKIYLPENAAGHLGEIEKTVAADSTGFGETVLVVEDEPVLLTMAQKMLEGLGYVVLTADRPSEALKIAEKYPGNIDLVFTDVVMPEMTGKEMAGLIQSLQPKTKILYMSGYTANVIAHNGILDEGINFLQKPYSRNELAQKIRDILDSKDQIKY